MAEGKLIPDVLRYFPDLKDNEIPDRQYMWKILNTLKPFATKELISNAQKNQSIENEDNIDDLRTLKNYDDD